MLFQNSLHLILIFIGTVLSIDQAHAACNRVYPSEYAYDGNSVHAPVSINSNCRNYPSDHTDGVFVGQYIQCDGTQNILSDSDPDLEEYKSSKYYQWNARSDGRLLFIFLTRVSLTTITLHYYSDSDRGLPRLRFYAVPDDFDAWDAPTTSYPHANVASVPPGGEPAGRSNVSINVNFNTKKVLMYKHSSNFQFAVSEMEFFLKCMQAEVTTIPTTTMTLSSSSTSSVQTTSDTSDTETIIFDFTEIFNDPTTKDSSMNTSTAETGTKMLRGQSKTVFIAIGVSAVTLLMVSSALIIIVVVLIRNYRRRSAEQELDTDAPYSTLNRDSRLQVQPQYIQQNSNELYDQIHLSPSTGQTEFIPKPQSENIYNPPYNSHPTHPETENSVTNVSAESQMNSPTATYAAIDKSNKKKAEKDDTKHTAAEKYTQKVSSSRGAHADNSIKRSQKSLEYMYASDHQDQERVNSGQESNPPHSVEELYTAVKKKPKGSSAPVNESVPQIAEDLYTAVMKKPKENSVNDEVVPPIPPRTVEELYTAVHKKPVGNTMEGEEEAPPIPPLTVEDTV